MYFEKIQSTEGLNLLKQNPCQLLNFGKVVINAGGSYAGNTGNSEAVLVTLSGVADITVGAKRFTNVGGRASVFAGKPHAVYLSPNCDYVIKVDKDASQFEAALALAKTDEKTDPFLITPDEVVSGKWGISNFSRTFNKILVKGLHNEHRVSRIIVGETFTPSGNWSTYPPVKPEKNGVSMEVMCYFRVNPSDGWGLTKYYTDDKSIDGAYTVTDDSVLKMPRPGYHTMVSAPGYTQYFLWFLAGNTRKQDVTVDPSLAWVAKAIPMISNIEENLS